MEPEHPAATTFQDAARRRIRGTKGTGLEANGLRVRQPAACERLGVGELADLYGE